MLDLSENKGWAENAGWKAPASARGPLLFRVPGFENAAGSEEYLVNMQFTANVNPLAKGTKYQSFDFAIFPVVTAVQESAYPPVELVFRGTDGSVGWGGTGGGPASDFKSHGEVAYPTRFPDGVRVRLVIDAPKTIGGWFHSRLARPTLSLAGKNSTMNTLTITGGATEIPITNVFVPGLDPRYKQIVERFESPYWLEYHRKEAEAGRGGGVSGGVWDPNSGVDYFRAWSPYLDEQAKGSAQAWLVSVMSADRLGRNRCTSDDSKIQGLINTNAMVYQSDIPEFKNGFLDYQVAGVHLSDKGEPNLGEYDLQIRSETARCLYGFSKAPLSAKVDVISRSGEKQIATTVVSEKAGWLRLAAYGFTFSEQKIRVKIVKSSGSGVEKITRFKGKAASISATQRSQISAVLNKANSPSAVSCTVNYKAASQKKLALKRAKSACAVVSELRPGVGITAVAKKTTKENSDGSLLLRVTGD